MGSNDPLTVPLGVDLAEVVFFGKVGRSLPPSAQREIENGAPAPQERERRAMKERSMSICSVVLTLLTALPLSAQPAKTPVPSDGGLAAHALTIKKPTSCSPPVEKGHEPAIPDDPCSTCSPRKADTPQSGHWECERSRAGLRPRPGDRTRRAGNLGAALGCDRQSPG